jgi:hypothetical protein
VRHPRSSEHSIFLHVCALVVVPGCLALAWWQATRALSGNTLSWAYTFEWPVFAGYALFMWWKLLHEEQTDRRGRPLPVHDAGAPSPFTAVGLAEPSHDGTDAVLDARADVEGAEEDPELAEYNAYLAALSASGRRKRW